MLGRRITAICAALELLASGCSDTPQPHVQVSPADLARRSEAPIPISPRVAVIYHDTYLPMLKPGTSGVFVISPDGNRVEYRSCHHPDCQMEDDEIALRALDRCNLGFAGKDARTRCLVFDLNGTILQPHRFWTDADFDMPAPPPPALSLSDPTELADPRLPEDRYRVMTPEGELRIALKADGSAYFWDTGDNFHQSTWALVQGGLCVGSVDDRAVMTCGTLYGTGPQRLAGATLDLYPGKFLPVTRLDPMDE